MKKKFDKIEHVTNFKKFENTLNLPRILFYHIQYKFSIIIRK